MSLTGGLDTRMIMAWEREKPGGSLLHVERGIFRDCYDVTLSREVAQLCGQRTR